MIQHNPTVLIQRVAITSVLKKMTTTKTHKDAKNEQTDHLFLLNMKVAKPACIYSEQD